MPKKKLDSNNNLKLVISEFNKSISLISDIDQLYSNFKSKIKELTSAAYVQVFLLQADSTKFVPIDNEISDHDLDLFFHQNDKMIFWMNVNRKMLVISKDKKVIDFFSESEQKILKKVKAEIAYPFIVMNQVKGFVLAGNSKTGIYNQEELNLLSTLFEYSGFAFENAMLYHQQRIRSKKMYHAERLASLGELAAGAAHEIRNPLTSIRSTIQYLEKKIKDANDKGMVKDLISEVDRINEIIQGLLSFARPEKIKMEKTNLNDIITQIINLLKSTTRKKNIELDLSYNTDNEILYSDQGQIKQVLLNIIMNAVQAIEKNKGKIGIRVEYGLGAIGTSHSEVPYFLIEIIDNGKGIDKKNIEKVFDPFFTTKNDGTGLGLSISFGIINNHGGEITINSEISKGTTVKIKLPSVLKN